MEEVVVSFRSKTRAISMYFTDNAGNLEMQMSVEPEFKDGEEPDLAMLLASTFMNALNTEDSKDDEPEIIIS